MRRAKACRACRERRRRCEIRVPGASCTHCYDRGLSCSSSEPSRALQSTNHTQWFPPGASLDASIPHQPPKGEESILPDQSLCTELVRLYFNYVHDQFHTLFHQPSFMEVLSQGKAPPILVYGMMALSARFSKNPIFSQIDARERGRKYGKECEKLLDWNDISLVSIQACVLLGAIAITDGKAGSENIHYAVACRMAQLLDIPRCKSDTALEQEVKIRDVWSSSGVRLPRLLTPIDDVPLPIDEVLFLEMSPDSEKKNIIPVEDGPRSSILAEMVRLNHILLQINQFNIRASENNLDTQSIMNDVEDLSKQLDIWFEELPDHMQDNRENLTRYSEQGLGRLLVALYLGYYNYGQMLYYRFLHEDSRVFDPRTRYYASKCKYHASKLCEIVYASEDVPGCDAKYNMVGHVLMIASTVQIHSLLFEEDECVVAIAKRRLEKNFCILTDLVSLWPTLDVCMDRLMTFHASCRDSAETSFRMDQWMVQFLVEFAKPVSGKSTKSQDKSSWSLSSMGITSH